MKFPIRTQRPLPLLSLLLFLSLLSSTPPLDAAPPGILHHQGRMVVDNVNFDGVGHFKFALVNATGSKQFWNNDHSGGTEPRFAVEVNVSKGHYAVPLGDTAFHANMTTPIPASVFTLNDNVRLRIWFATDERGPFEQLSPDQRLASVGYALSAAAADGVGAGAITGAMLAPDAVTGDKIAPGTLSALETPDGALPGVLAIGPEGSATVSPGGDPGLQRSSILFRGNIDEGLDRPRQIAVQGDFAYVLDSGLDVLAIFDLTDPENIVSRGTTSLNFGFPQDVAIQGDYAYVVGDSPGRLNIYDISDPDVIVPKDSYLLGALSIPIQAVVEGDFVYLIDLDATVDDLQIFDVSDPDNIDPQGTFETGLEGPVSIAVGGGHAYIVDVLNESFAAFDVSNPAAISAKDVVDTGAWTEPNQIVVRGNHAYLAVGSPLGSTGFLAIYNISDPANIVLEDSNGINLATPDAVAVEGDFAYVADRSSGAFATFDVTDPSDIVPLGSADYAFSIPFEIAVQGRFAYVADSSHGILLFELQPQLTVDGSLFVSGHLVDSNQTAGTTGQILSATGVGTGWIDLLDNDPTNELQSLSLSSSDSLSLSAGGTVSLSRFLRSNASDTYSGGALTFASDSAVLVDGSFYMNNFQGLQFLAGAERFYWTANRFITTDGMVIQGPIRVGTIAGANFDYNDLSNIVTFPESGAMDDDDDLFVGEDLEVGEDLFLSGSLKMGTAETDQFIFFYEGGSDTGESLSWNNTNDRFNFSENVNIASGGSTAQLRLLQTSASAYSRLELATVDGGRWIIAAQNGTSGDLRFYNGTSDRMILEDNGDLAIGGTLSQGSDRHRKEHIVPVDPTTILESVTALPIARWSYRDDPAATPHLGPMSQDFHAAFAVGDDETRIPSIDADGVALAAIQGLNAKVEAENAALRAENAALRERLERVEALLEQLALDGATH